MRGLLTVSALAITHAALTMVALFAAFGAASARLDSGAAPGAGQRILDGALQLLSFPIVWIASEHAPAGWSAGYWGYVPIALNSLLWAAVLVYAARRIRRGGI